MLVQDTSNLVQISKVASGMGIEGKETSFSVMSLLYAQQLVQLTAIK
jgi:hypothetical protein